MSSDPTLGRKVALQVPYLQIKKPRVDLPETVPLDQEKECKLKDGPSLSSNNVEAPSKPKPQLITFPFDFKKLPTFAWDKSVAESIGNQKTPLHSNGERARTITQVVDVLEKIDTEGQPSTPSASPLRSRLRRSVHNSNPPVPVNDELIDSVETSSNEKRILRKKVYSQSLESISTKTPTRINPAHEKRTLVRATIRNSKGGVMGSESSKSQRRSSGSPNKRSLSRSSTQKSKRRRAISHSVDKSKITVSTAALFQRHAKQDGDNRIQIPLENLKASEIEALMAQYQTGIKTSKTRTQEPVSSSTSTQRNSKRTRSSASNKLEVKDMQLQKQNVSSSGLPDDTFSNDSGSSDIDEERDTNLIKCETPISSQSKIKRKSIPVQRLGTELSKNAAKFTCQICKIGFSSTERMLYGAHFKNHHKQGNKFYCPDCPNLYKTIFSLNHHMKSHKNSTHKFTDRKIAKQATAIPKLEAPTRELPKLKVSNRTVSKPVTSALKSTKQDLPEKYKCNVCGKQMKRCHKVIFVHHQTHKQSPNTIYINKGVECTICHGRFVGKEELRNHLVIHLEDSDDLFECEYPGCGSTYSSKANLKRHAMQKH